MTKPIEVTPPPVPAYGIRTCGKPAPAPLDLGPCRREPGHEGGCQYAALGGLVSVEDIHEGNGMSPLDMVRDIENMHRQTRAARTVTFAASLISVASAAYLVTEAVTGGLG